MTATPTPEGWREYRRLINEENLTPPEAYERVMADKKHQYDKGPSK